MNVFFLGLEFDDVTDLVLVEISRTFLPVSRNKRHGRSLGREFEHDRDL